MLERLRERFRRPGTAEDVAADPATAGSRDTGGADRDDADSASTTGTGSTEEFVGRVSGQDVGFAGETGAEARAAAARDT